MVGTVGTGKWKGFYRISLRYTVEDFRMRGTISVRGISDEAGSQ